MFDVSRFRDFHLHFALGPLLLVLALAVAGCTPPGPRALLQGKRLLENGKTDEAIEKFKTATSLLSSNAQAWNYLGVAYHQAGKVNEAADAYKRAITYDQNLVEARYNLGCLWLEQNRPDLAKPELTAYTLRRDKSAEGWIKLGDAQLRTRDILGAEKSFNQARQFDAQNPEALNGLGVAQMQRNHAADAGQFFSAALKAKPDYAPALLNLAIASEFYLNNKQYALQRYRDYLSLNPRPANWDAVNATARALQLELNPASVATPLVAARPAAPTNPAPPVAAQPAGKAAAAAPARAAARTEPTAAKPVPAQSAQQIGRLAPEPAVKSVQDGAGSASEPVVVTANKDSGQVASNSQKPGFFSRIFKGSPKTSEQVESGKPAANTPRIASAPAESAPEPKFPRYAYHALKKPQDGDRGAAEKAFSQGLRDQQASDLSAAIENYRKATQADPAYFEAYYNLGLASAQAGNLPQSLAAYETALAIRPDSHDALFNFALVLKRGNYAIDAANELEKLLAKYPNDASAHYALGTIYAQQLRQTGKARDHYQKALELDPTIPQAAAIHDWLFANPR